MAIKPLPDMKKRVIDKAWLRRKFAEMDARSGFVVDPAMTAQKVREMMLADGVKPEDNAFSREIIKMRYEEE